MSETAIIERLDSIESVLLRLLKQVDRNGVPVARMTQPEVIATLRTSRATVCRLIASGVFSDARPRCDRRKGSKRLFFSDEVQLYILEGAPAVKRFRKEVGRN